MAQKIHLRQTVQGGTACANKGVTSTGKAIRNARSRYQCIPANYVVSPDESAPHQTLTDVHTAATGSRQ